MNMNSSVWSRHPRQPKGSSWKGAGMPLATHGSVEPGLFYTPYDLVMAQYTDV